MKFEAKSIVDCESPYKKLKNIKNQKKFKLEMPVYD